MSRRYDPRNQPAWPLGCAVAFFGLLLIFNLLWLGGGAFAAGGLPVWLQRAGPALMALTVPALMLAGGLYARRRNAYGSRVLIWGFALTVLSCALITILLNVIDRLSGV
ncbi:MAG TPA: hypothetical protein PKD53_21510 [Chloroflexaceae bacterium]|nr:hypothetical protein [Chloroflexaceae bacterium]